MELLDIVDENGLPTGRTVEREKAHLEGRRHRTSHVWLVRERDGKTQVLLQKRSDNKDSFPGCFDISSAGHIPAGVDFIPSAVRELKEELGIDINGEELIFCGNRDVAWNTEFYGRPFIDRQYSRIFALWCDKDEAEFTLQEEEVSQVMWMDLDAAIEAVKDNTIRHCIYSEELMMVRSAIKNEF